MIGESEASWARTEHKRSRRGRRERLLTSQMRGMRGLSIVTEGVEVSASPPLEHLLWDPQMSLGLAHLSAIHLPAGEPPHPHSPP